MRTKAILIILVFSSLLATGQLQIHHQSLTLSPINSINENQFYATLGGLGHTIFTKVTLEPLSFEYLESIVFDESITYYGLVGKKGLAIDYEGENYISSDGFQTMEKQTEHKFKKVYNTTSGLVSLGIDNKIYFTSDGESWEEKANASELRPKGDLVWGTNSNGQHIYSENGGKNWKGPIEISHVEAVLQVSDMANPSTLIIHNSNNGKFHISSDKGTSWKTYTGFQGMAASFNFIDANYGFADVINLGVLGTKDGGETWVGLSQFFSSLPETGTPQIWSAINGLIYISINGKLYYTKDKGQTWTFFHATIGGKFYDIDQKGDVILIGGANGYYAISKDGGKIFHEGKRGNEDIMAVGVIDEDTYALGDRKGQVIMLYEGGNSGGKKTSSSGNYNALHFETSADEKTILSTRIGQPAISTDAAQNFKIVNIGGGTHFQTIKPNGDIIDVTQGGIISKVNANNGQKTELQRISGANVRRISMATDNVGYVLSFKDGSSMKTYVTKDNWTNYTSAGVVDIPSSSGYISVSHIADGHVIVTADGVNRMFETTDFGTTWTSTTLGLLNTFANRINPLVGSHFNSSNDFWVVTETGYLFRNKGENSIPTSTFYISNLKDKNLLIYPNPATNFIQIESSEDDISTIEIFNLNGSKILHLNHVNKSPIDISRFQGGIYFIHITSKSGYRNTFKFIKN